jgi:hypothetical protein
MVNAMDGFSFVSRTGQTACPIVIQTPSFPTIPKPLPASGTRNGWMSVIFTSGKPMLERLYPKQPLKSRVQASSASQYVSGFFTHCLPAKRVEITNVLFYMG